MKIKSIASKSSVVSAIALGFVGSAHAELPAAATAALDQVSAFADDMIAWAWVIVGTVLAASIGIKLLKKFASKAT
jgi:hypothetical protein